LQHVQLAKQIIMRILRSVDRASRYNLCK